MRLKSVMLYSALICSLTSKNILADANYQSNHYDNANGVFFNPNRLHDASGQSPNRPSFWQDINIMLRLSFFNKKNDPQCILPFQVPDWKKFLDDTSADNFIWLGHSTVLIRTANQTIMTDPIFDSASPFSWMFPRWQPAPVARKDLPDVDTILISHNHFDHLDEQTARFYAGKNTLYVVPLGIAKNLTEWGVHADHIKELDWYQSFDYKGVRYTAVPAQHTSGRGLRDTNKSLWAGWVIEYSNHRYYFSGDTGYDGGSFKAIHDKFGHFDVAFIENGQYDPQWPDDHMMPEQTILAAKEIGADIFVPVHWGAYTMAFHTWNDPVKRTTSLSVGEHLRELTPVPGEIFTKNSSSSKWWSYCKKQ